MLYTHAVMPSLFLLRTLAGWILGAAATPATIMAVVTAASIGADLGGALSLLLHFWAAAFAGLLPSALAHLRSGGRPAALPVALAIVAGPSAAAIGYALLGRAQGGTDAAVLAWVDLAPLAACVVAAAVVAIAVRPGADAIDWRRVTLLALAAHGAGYVLHWALQGPDVTVPAVTTMAASFALFLAMIGLVCGAPAAWVMRLVAGARPG